MPAGMSAVAPFCGTLPCKDRASSAGTSGRTACNALPTVPNQTGFSSRQGIGHGAFPLGITGRASQRRGGQQATGGKAVPAEDMLPSLGSPDAVKVPMSWYQLLRLNRTCTAQAAKQAHQSLLASPPTGLGLSRETLACRERVLESAALFLLDSATRKLYDSALAAAAKAGQDPEAEVEFDDVPGVLCLVYEAGEIRLVADWGKAWLEVEATDPRAKDVAVLVAMACWDAAVARLAEQPDDVVTVSDGLADGLAVLERHRASPELRQQITAALEELAPSVAVRLVSLPLDEDFAELRRRGLEVLRCLFRDDPRHYFRSEGDLSQYLTTVRAQLTTSEQASVLSSLEVTPASTVGEVFEVALGFVAEGCRTYQPSLVRKAANMLEEHASKVYEQGGSEAAAAAAAAGGVDPLDVTVGRAVCQLLLGRHDKAADVLGLGPGGNADQSVYEFVAEHSVPVSGDSEVRDLRPGMDLLAQRWLEDIAFSTCRRSAPQGPFSLEDWFENSRVKLYNQVVEGPGIPSVVEAIGAAASAVAGAVLPTATPAPATAPGRAAPALGGDQDGPGSAATLQLEAEAAVAAAQGDSWEVGSGGSAGVVAGQPGVQVLQRQGGESGAGGSGGGAGRWVLGGAALLLLAGYGAREQLAQGLMGRGATSSQPPPPPATSASSLQLPGWVRPTNWRVPSVPSVRMPSLPSLPSLPSVSLPEVRMPTVPMPSMPSMPMPSMPSMPSLPSWVPGVGGGSGSAVRGPVAGPASSGGGGTAVDQVGASSSSCQQMSVADAHNLVKQWQATKAEALGPRHATKRLDSVLSGSMLDQWKQRAEDVKGSGWHWEYQLTGMSIDSVRDLPNNRGVVVAATFDEVACIVERGQVQESYANKYSIQYDLAREGGKWKIVSGHILNM